MNFFKKMRTGSKAPELPSEAPKLPELPSDTARPIRLGAFVLLFGLGGFVLWAVLAPLDEGVPTNGTVSIATKSKIIQHSVGGIVKAVHVAEGQIVEQNEILITLDEAVAKAGFEEVRQQYISLRARESRLIAEINGSDRLQFHEFLQAHADDPYVARHMMNQKALFDSRRRALRADLAGIDASIASLQAQIQGLEAVKRGREAQGALVGEQLNNLADLVAAGYATRTEQNELEQRLAQLVADASDARSNIASRQKSIIELQERHRSRQEAYRVEGDSEMTEIRREVDAIEMRLQAQSDELARVEIRSPVAGQVVDLQKQTVGGFIQQGEKIMNVVPLGENLMLEAKVPPHLIDRVSVGLDADVRFSSFANSPQLFVDGKVESISRDLIVEENPNQTDPTYYLARISITPEGMKTLGNREMQPGMPVQVVIKTGERSLLTYLLHPLTKRFAASLKEE